MEYIGYLCTQYELFKIHISPNLGGALEAIPSQLQLTISVCLAVRTSIDFPPGGQSANIKVNKHISQHLCK